MNDELEISFEDLLTARRVLEQLEVKHTELARYVGETADKSRNPLLEETASKLWEEAHTVLDAECVIQQYLDGYYKEEQAA